MTHHGHETHMSTTKGGKAQNRTWAGECVLDSKVSVICAEQIFGSATRLAPWAPAQTETESFQATVRRKKVAILRILAKCSTSSDRDDVLVFPYAWPEDGSRDNGPSI